MPVADRAEEKPSGIEEVARKITFLKILFQFQLLCVWERKSQKKSLNAMWNSIKPFNICVTEGKKNERKIPGRWVG